MKAKKQTWSMPVNNAKDVFAELPATTYKYICTPFMDSAEAANGTTDDIKAYGAPVREYWAQAEESMTAKMGEVLAEAAIMDPAQAAARIESYCTSVQDKKRRHDAANG